MRRAESVEADPHADGSALDGTAICQRHEHDALPGDARLADAGEDLRRTDQNRLTGTTYHRSPRQTGSKLMRHGGCGQQAGGKEEESTQYLNSDTLNC